MATNKKGPHTTTPDSQLEEEANVNANQITTSYMETEHEMSNIVTSDNRTTTEMRVVWRRQQQHHGTLDPSFLGYEIMVRTDDGQTH